MKYVLAAIAVVAILVGGWFGFWALARANQQQQYQASLISQERDRVAGYDAAADGPQKEQIKSTFCAIYLTLKPAPEDLAAAYSRICF